QDELAALKDKLEQKEAEVKRLQEKLVCKLKGEGIEILDRGNKKEVSLTVSSSVSSSEDRKIEELRQSLNRYKKVQDMVILAQGKKGKESDGEDFLNSGSASTVLLDTPSLTDPEKSLSTTPVTASPIHNEFNVNIHEENSLQIHTSILQISIPSFSSMSKSSETVAEKVRTQPRPDPAREMSEGRSTGSSPETQLCDSPVSSSLQKASSLSSLRKETSEVVGLQVKPRVEGNNFATLPPKSPSHGGTGDEDSFGTRKARSSFGRGFFKIKNNKRTASAPNL
ncbi:LIPB1 protein, partial [Nycticryphes semicollaris]|nr:LIPB1 protein [Nycticryphes semicollaris]